MESKTTGDGQPNQENDAPVRSERRGTRFTGTEPIFGAFTHASTIITNVRLTHYGRIYSQVNDIGASVTAMARDYRFHGDAVRAYQDLVRLRSNFEGRVQHWRNEEAVRLQNKKSLNGNQLRELEKELNRVYLEIARGESTLNRLQNDLDLISRVGDDCPLIKPQQHSPMEKERKNQSVTPVIQKKKKTNNVLLSLHELCKPDGLLLSFSSCRYHDDFDDTIREHCYDQASGLSVLTHWSNRNPLTRERGEVFCRVYLVPKNVEALGELEGLIQDGSFLLACEETCWDLEFQRLSISQEKTLVSKSMTEYLYDLEASGFQHRDLIVKRPFEFFGADFCPAIAFAKGIQTRFYLRYKSGTAQEIS